MKRAETIEALQASLGPSVRIKSVSGVAVAPVKIADPLKPTVKGIIRQSGAQPNKTEIRFENDYLGPQMKAGEIRCYAFAALTLKIGNGVRYTPDFWAINGNGTTVFFEIKGRQIWDDAIVKLKVAAAKYNHYEFWLCAWDKQWTVQRVLP